MSTITRANVQWLTTILRTGTVQKIKINVVFNSDLMLIFVIFFCSHLKVFENSIHFTDKYNMVYVYLLIYLFTFVYFSLL